MLRGLGLKFNIISQYEFCKAICLFVRNSHISVNRLANIFNKVVIYFFRHILNSKNFFTP